MGRAVDVLASTSMSRAPPSPEIAAALGAIELPDAFNRPVRLSSLFATSPTVVVHLRHFGCLYCRQQLAKLQAALPAFQKLKAQVVAIGTGDVAYAKKLTDEMGLQFTVLSDDNVKSYEAVQAKTISLLHWVAPSNLMTMKTVMGLGYKQGVAGNHQKYLGATHVFLREGKAVYAWLNDDFSSDAPLNQVLDALDVL
jgi:peroxiredoxin